MRYKGRHEKVKNEVGGEKRRQAGIGRMTFCEKV